MSSALTGPRKSRDELVAEHAAEIAPPKRLRRPRAGPEALAERERLHASRVEYVADLMRDLKFRTGYTHDALSVEWDLPKSVVSKISIEASRIVRAELTDHDRVLSKVTRALDYVIDDAIASGDRHCIVKAAQVWAQVSGAGAPTKVTVGPDLEALSPEQLRARKAEIIARLTNGAIDVAAGPTEPAALPEQSECP